MQLAINFARRFSAKAVKADAAAAIELAAKTAPSASSNAPVKAKKKQGQQQQVPEQYRVSIPTRKPPGYVSPTAPKCYRAHIDGLNELVEQTKLPADDSRRTVLLSMIDSMNTNPTMSLDKKREMLQIAIRFFKGEKFDLSVRALEGTQQAKAAPMP